MNSCRVKRALAVLLCVSLSLSGVLAAKAGDKGKGWEVVERDNGYGYVQLKCMYDGKFKIEGSDRLCGEWGSTTGQSPCPSPEPFIKRTGGEKVSLGEGKKNAVWRIKTARSGWSTIRSATNRKYLTPETDVRTAEWDTAVVMGLSKKKWRYDIIGQDSGGDDGQWDTIDCLKAVGLLSESDTWISYNSSSREFRYDSDENGSWNLIPV